MKVYVYPADETGCGSYRMIWPAEVLKKQGHDVVIVRPHERTAHFRGVLDSTGTYLVDVLIPEDADVIVLQRITHKHLIDAIKVIRSKGVAVVVDMDDDLAAIDPRNPAFMTLHSRHGQDRDHNWMNTQRSCEAASFVVVSSDALLPRYAPHGRGVVIENHVPERYLRIPRVDDTIIGWGGSTHSHPGDLQVVGSGVAALMDETTYLQIGPADGIQQALRLDFEPAFTGPLKIHDEWPKGLAKLGIGIAPLEDTRFNAAKSYLKPLEYSALGIPWVASPRAEYVKFHDRYEIGALAEKPKHWTRELRKLVRDDAYRQEMSKKCREAAAQLTIEDNAYKWWNAWEEAYRVENA